VVRLARKQITAARLNTATNTELLLAGRVIRRCWLEEEGWIMRSFQGAHSWCCRAHIDTAKSNTLSCIDVSNAGTLVAMLSLVASPSWARPGLEVVQRRLWKIYWL